MKFARWLSTVPASEGRMPTRIILMCPVFILLLRIKYLLKSKTDTTPAFLEPVLYGYQVYFKIPLKYTLNAEAHIIHLK